MKSRQLNFDEPIEKQIKLPLGNKKLVNYGILQEQSDYRAHVGYLVHKVYIFPTESGRKAVEEAKRTGINIFTATQLGMDKPTAEGYAIPTSRIEGLQEKEIPYDLWNKHKIHREALEEIKGMCAAQIVYDMLKRGLIPLPVNVDLNNNVILQIKGTDIIINSRLKIQVKCDYKAGDINAGGTGNLFLQTKESNPYQRY